MSPGGPENGLRGGESSPRGRQETLGNARFGTLGSWPRRDPGTGRDRSRTASRTRPRRRSRCGAAGRRRRTVSAYREGGRTIVLIPARFTKAEERRWVDTMLGRLAGDRRRRPDDAELSARARALSSRYLADAARPTSVRWVGNQMSRWGSCTPADGTIRVSERLKGMPGTSSTTCFHELAHLLRPAHDREFWRLLAAYPRVERARGYLEGIAAAGSGPGRTTSRSTCSAPMCGSGRRGLRADDALLAPRQGATGSRHEPGQLIDVALRQAVHRPPRASSDSALTRGTAPGGAVAA